MDSKILQPTHHNLKEAAQRIRDGYLVAIPTETVYGLGANAMDDEACRKVYKVKGRPATDPLICHVCDINQALSLWGCDNGNTARNDHIGSSGTAHVYTNEAKRLAEHLGRCFWPGPLTIVARAGTHVAPCVTGGSEYVGVRIPNHSVALELLKLAGVPVAAPSANIFGHVSPTTARHVFDDLSIRDPELRVIDGGCCEIGIESTVVKVVLDLPDTSLFSEGSAKPLPSLNVEVLRRGSISVSDIQTAIEKFPSANYECENKSNDTTYVSSCNTSGNPISRHPCHILPYLHVRDTRSKYMQETDIMDGPGQLLTHYSPNIPCFLLSPVEVQTLSKAAALAGDIDKPALDISISMGPTAPPIKLTNYNNNVITSSPSSSEQGQYSDGNTALATIIVLDFADVLKPIIPCPASSSGIRYVYRSLSQTGSIEEAGQNVFDALRWTETVCDTGDTSEKGFKEQQQVVVLFPFLSEWNRLVSVSTNEMLYAVEDRLFRAASGKIATIVTADGTQNVM